jgi:hypothetical protein
MNDDGLVSTENDWEAYDDCWENNPDADPWAACYSEGEYGTCVEAEKEALEACYDEAYGPIDGGDDSSHPPTDYMPASPTDDPCADADDQDACIAEQADNIMSLFGEGLASKFGLAQIQK